MKKEQVHRLSGVKRDNAVHINIAGWCRLVTHLAHNQEILGSNPNPAAKRCPGCHTSKSWTLFYKNKSRPDGLDAYCKECRNKRSLRHNQEYPDLRRKLDREKYHRYKEFINNFKRGKPCRDCNIVYPTYVTHFDHLDSSTKLENISHMRNMAKIIAEIEKCDLVCDNCHAIREHNRRSLVLVH